MTTCPMDLNEVPMMEVSTLSETDLIDALAHGRGLDEMFGRAELRARAKTFLDRLEIVGELLEEEDA